MSENSPPDLKALEPEVTGLNPGGSGRQVVVLLSEEYRAVAAEFAMAKGAVLVPHFQHSGWNALVNQYRPKSLVFFGCNSLFSVQLLAVLNQILPVPWGIVCGENVSEAKELAARQLAPKLPEEKSTWVVDGMNGCVKEFRNRGRQMDVAPVETSDLPARITADMDILAIIAHGESNHCNLKTAVMCGLVQTHEQYNNAPLEGGCCRHASHRFCKRKQAHHQQVLFFQELNTHCLLLFTCNGIDLCHALYPSNHSIIAATLSAKVTTVLGFSEPFEFEPWQETLTLRMLWAGYAVGTVQQVLNDLFEKRSGRRPVVLIGDPDFYYAAKNDQAKPFRIESKPKGSHLMIALATSAPDRELLNGMQYVVTLGKPDADCPPGWEEASLTFNALQARLLKWEKALHHAQNLQKSLTMVPGPSQRKIQGYNELLKEASAITTELDQLLFNGAMLCHTSQQNGVLSPQLIEVSVLAEQLGNIWDRTICKLMANGFIQLNFHQYLTAGSAWQKAEEGESCHYCGNALETRTYTRRQTLDRILFTHCANCGPKQVAPADVSVGIDCPTQCKKGETIVVKVMTKGGSESGGRVVLQIKDNGKQQVVVDRSDAYPGHAISLNVTLPVTVASEIHTLRVVVVQQMEICYLRTRITCLP